MIMSKQPQVKCKKCGRSAPADSFVLDHLQGMLLCPDCIREQRTNSKVTKEFVTRAASNIMSSGKINPSPRHSAQPKPTQEEEKAPVKERPPGWDSEDEYLERSIKQRSKSSIEYERVDESKVRYVCTKCRFKFVYHTEKRYPSMCPNCGTPVIRSLIR
ncbi:hypothetical protein FJZ53_00620 [Candidatus Woesearchaeota archaeon]|nr:hypothetical protein [Candidatus Woesearchaeota archaeon]